ncbi:MAG: hypothetical protein ACFBSF_06355 [Leptolyngbyaceae cyanobacterium]
MRILKIHWVAIASFVVGWSQAAGALPPPEDPPEEILRTEIILEARSPLDGDVLTAAEYDQLQEELSRNDATLLSSQIRELIFLLQLRRVVKPVIPFLP